MVTIRCFSKQYVNGSSATRTSALSLAEIYSPSIYAEYLQKGHFDILYDKVETYDTLRNIVTGKGDANHLSVIMKKFHDQDIDNHMLRFIENHDEQRAASGFFAGDPWKAWPAMVVSATISTSPVMIYFGQEVGEPGAGDEGFSGNDGRTTIYDYWGVPNHQKWMDDGKFDGGQLNDNLKKLRSYYARLLNLCNEKPEIYIGDFYDLSQYNYQMRGGSKNTKVYAFMRIKGKSRLCIVVNFSADAEFHPRIYFPDPMKFPEQWPSIKNLLNNEVILLTFNSADHFMQMHLKPLQTLIFELPG